MANDAQTSINIPQIIAVAVVGFLAIRWFMSKPSSSSGSTSATSSRSRNNIDPAKIQAVSAVFPQLDQRSIAWDLQRNGGNVEATMERVLGGRGLESPPPSFHPTLPEPAATASTTATSSATSKAAGQSDLITRYGLQSKVGGKGKEPVPSEEQKRGTWSSDKAARANALKRRREDMILAARRKMEEKERQA
ncbi:hypothetical protein DOTSEDRAFT_75859 [Dothistroma septosporum NZE10]|uniref:Coupling of ubiquitin conjugation to ER degradation protein 1 n=1 Tax=Dothistroma septosporum (strain NZE10 / CBS 128990) TaxID=675120 RepID=N1PBV6_DOTSN|nr:hypothetical protein DOTSEDRAFT_75859 [Dothistroma septosporum NZE10]